MKKQVFLFIVLSTCFLQLLNAQIGSVKQRGGKVVVYDKNGYELSANKNSAEILGYTNSFWVAKCRELTPNFKGGMELTYWIATLDYKSRQIAIKFIDPNDVIKIVNNKYIYLTHNNVTEIYDENFQLIDKKK